MVVDFMPRLVRKYVKQINSLLAEGQKEQADELFNNLPVNIKVKINAIFRRSNAKDN